MSPLNAGEVSALLGDFRAVTLTAPTGTKRAAIRVVSQMGPMPLGQPRRGERTLFVYDFSKPLRVIVGLAGDPLRRGEGAVPLSLSGEQPCTPEQQLAILGASTASETNVASECLSMGDRADTIGGGGGATRTTPKLNVWTPVYTWYFNRGTDSTGMAFDAARNDPAAQIVWWVYFSSSADAEAPVPPLYTPRP
ncbi:hypothetical protein [Deinococcus sp. JMULE3]|uniref:hypothetical protein n=1 Tax=Deinococcus sp. JMULE3 TaxID=2518341 RepID=UPI001576913F|nr:hypothetical protein [Deinococcus sp. JMULE3]